jgi:hypothetical protein
MSISDRMRVRLRITSWSAEDQSGVVIDEQGSCYNVRLADMGPEFRDTNIPITPGELVEAFVVDYNRVAGVLSTGRAQFESVGPAPDAHANPDPLRGTPDTGLGGGKPDTGRFSHPK